MTDAVRIEHLGRPVSDRDIRGLALLLIDAVESGAAVTFVAPLPLDRAEAWWRRTISDAADRSVFLVARRGDDIVGTVQLQPPAATNQQHRGEIAKLIVHRSARRSGIGARLMQTIEEAARANGFALLTLDTKRGDGAEELYRRAGWTALGAIPGYGLDPDGTAHDAVFFFKELRGGG